MYDNIFAQMGFIATESEDHTSSSDIQDELPLVMNQEESDTVVDKLHDSVGGPINEQRMEEELPMDEVPSEIEKEIEEIEKTGEIDHWVGTDVMEIEGDGNPEILNGGVPAGPAEDEPTVPIIDKLEEAGEINKSEFLDNSFGENNEVNDMLMEQLDQEERTEDMGLSAPVEETVITEKNTDFVVQEAEPNSVKDSFVDGIEESEKKDPEEKPELVNTEVEEKEVEGDETSALDEAKDVEEEVKTEVKTESEDVETKEETKEPEEDKPGVLQPDDNEYDHTEIDEEVKIIESITIDTVIDGSEEDVKEAEKEVENTELDGSSAFDETPAMVSVNTGEGQQEFPEEVVPEGVNIVEPEEQKDETVATIIEDVATTDTEEHPAVPVEQPAEEIIEEEQKEVQAEIASESVLEKMKNTILSWL